MLLLGQNQKKKQKNKKKKNATFVINFYKENLIKT